MTEFARCPPSPNSARVGSLVVLCVAALVACSASPKGTATQEISGARMPSPALGMERTISQIPWRQVGPGWILATWSQRADPNSGSSPTGPAQPETPLTLYLFDPAGARYAITAVAPSPPAGPGDPGRTPRLADWSGDGRHALFEDFSAPGGHTAMTEVDLATGAKHTFIVDQGYVMGAYTRPTGQAILLSKSNSSNRYGHILERVDLNGAKTFTFPTDRLGAAGEFRGEYLQTPDGGQLVFGTDKGMVVVGNDGVIVRQLPIPGPRGSCRPVRWWTAAVILAACDVAPTSSPMAVAHETQVWQVPLAGGTPTALTPASGQDLGYWNAWQVPGGTFLQNVPGCGGDGLLFRLTPDMQTKQVVVPGVDRRNSVFVVGVTGDKLVLKATRGCGSRTMSLLIYDPAANTATVLPGPPGNGGVKGALLYPAG